MSANPIVSVRNKIISVFDLDREAQNQIVAQHHRAHLQIELARAAMGAISQTILESEYQVSQLLKVSKAIEDSLASAGIPAEEYVAYNQLIRHEYLQKMAAVTRKATDAISRQVG